MTFIKNNEKYFMIKIIIFVFLIIFACKSYSCEDIVASPVIADVVVLKSISDIGSINLILKFLKKNEANIDVDASEMLFLMMDENISDINYYFNEITVTYVKKSACNLSNELDVIVQCKPPWTSDEELNFCGGIKELHDICNQAQ